MAFRTPIHSLVHLYNKYTWINFYRAKGFRTESVLERRAVRQRRRRGSINKFQLSIVV